MATGFGTESGYRERGEVVGESEKGALELLAGRNLPEGTRSVPPVASPLDDRRFVRGVSHLGGRAGTTGVFAASS